MPNPPAVPPQKNRSVLAGQPPRAKTAMVTRPVALWVSEAALGMLFGPRQTGGPTDIIGGLLQYVCGEPRIQ